MPGNGVVGGGGCSSSSSPEDAAGGGEAGAAAAVGVEGGAAVGIEAGAAVGVVAGAAVGVVAGAAASFDTGWIWKQFVHLPFLNVSGEKSPQGHSLHLSYFNAGPEASFIPSRGLKPTGCTFFALEGVVASSDIRFFSISSISV